MATGYVNPLSYDSILAASKFKTAAKPSSNFGSLLPSQTNFLPTPPAGSIQPFTVINPSTASNMSSWQIPTTNAFGQADTLGGFTSMPPGQLAGPPPGYVNPTEVLPPAEGGWFDTKGKGGMLLGAAQIGLGAWNVWEQSKQNKFMKDYYTQQMNMQKTDFMNAAHDYNRTASEREGRRLDASQGIAYDSAANKAGRDEYMKTWGAKETF